MSSKKYFLFIIVMIFNTSCTKDFLEVDNTERLFQESYVRDLASIQEYVTGIYYKLSSELESREMVSTYSDLVSDNLRPLSNTSSPTTTQVYSWTQSASPGQRDLWSGMYLTIRMCSFVVDNVNNYRDENPEKADNLKGQAFAIRALLHFKLLNTFAQPYTFTVDASHPGVPYITTSDITQTYTRLTVAEGYTGMIDDLTNAIALLPSETSDTRYMNRNAAKALLARIYLSKEDFTKAKTLAEEVANQVPLLTIGGGYPNDIFKLKQPSSTESLFQLTPYSFSNFLGRYVRRAPIGYVATNDVAIILKENLNDIRSSWVNSVSTGWNVVKFPSGAAPLASPTVSTPENAYYPVIVRSSEMFLIVAEAAAKTNDENTARTYLNTIRKRSNPSIADVTATGQALLDSVYKERRKELAFEGLRMFDLLRWKQGVNRMDVLPGSPAVLPYPSNKAISPIPESEVRLSGISQNAGY